MPPYRFFQIPVLVQFFFFSIVVLVRPPRFLEERMKKFNWVWIYRLRLVIGARVVSLSTSPRVRVNDSALWKGCGASLSVSAPPPRRFPVVVHQCQIQCQCQCQSVTPRLAGCCRSLSPQPGLRRITVRVSRAAAPPPSTPSPLHTSHTLRPPPVVVPVVHQYQYQYRVLVLVRVCATPSDRGTLARHRRSVRAASRFQSYEPTSPRVWLSIVPPAPAPVVDV
ncbi:hypothetical protein BKA62DRAFT_418127 [Auriculariales sp. MPI-PUGE-AT-0066]|nr:hypothetical protein BKA62DRAFT_418127 [Auriculariales sp. MPI-PUGE-AT-0066]